MRACFFLAAALLAAAAAAAQPPDTPDPLRYLEDASDPRTQQMLSEQGARARAVLDAIPGRGEMLARVRALSEAGPMVTRVKLGGSRVFYARLEAGAATASLYVREGTTGAERLLLDPARLDPRRPAAIHGFSPSPDGRHVAVGISAGGDMTLRVIAVDGARLLPFEIDRAPRVDDVAWHPDGRSFYYARVPEGDAQRRRTAHARIYRHVLGRETARDEIVFAAGVGGAREVPEHAIASLHLPAESRHAYAVVREGERRDLAVHVADQRDLAAGKPRWHRLAGPEDEVLAIEGWRDDLYVLSRHNAPRHRLLRLRGDAASLAAARPVVPQGEAVIEAFGLARDAIYLKTQVGGAERLERLTLGLLGAKAPEYIRTPFDTAISQLVTHPRAPGALLRLQGWIEPPAVVQVEPGSGNLKRTPIQPPSPLDFSAMDEVRLYATGHDGTRIPVTLVYRKATRLDRQNPLLLTAFGSHGVTPAPRFDPALMAWLERGGIFAVAHVRGGGEYGGEWHRAGRQSLKRNTVLDFLAAAEFVVRYGFTNPRRLAIAGTGAGGIPVGAALVRRPELFAAAIAHDPLMDLARFEALPGGAAHVAEFGSASTAEGLQSLLELSPYHNIQGLTAYPAVLLTSARDDAPIEPWQPAKMALMLQAVTTSGKPVLLRMDPEPGREGDRRGHAESLADIYSFLLWQMEAR